MKLAFISDIHGNAEALDAVLNDINERKIDKKFILGDLCFRGLEPKRVLSMVSDLDVPVIKGNADEWVVRGIRETEVPKEVFARMNEERDWTYSKIDKDDLYYLSSLPEELNLEFDKWKIHAFHATPNSLFEVVQSDRKNEELRDKLMEKEADIYIYAHIHKAYIRYIDGKCLVNTGSVGLPLDGVRKASYTMIEIHENSYSASIIRVSYDVDKVISQFKDSDYPNKELLMDILDNGF